MSHLSAAEHLCCAMALIKASLRLPIFSHLVSWDIPENIVAAGQILYTGAVER